MPVKSFTLNMKYKIKTKKERRHFYHSEAQKMPKYNKYIEYDMYDKVLK